MTNTNTPASQVKVGQVIKLTAKPELGSQLVEVGTVNADGSFEGFFGRLSDDGKEFLRRSYKPKTGGKDARAVRSATFAAGQVAEVITTIKRKANNVMAKANKDAAADTAAENGAPELTYVPDGAEGSPVDGAEGQPQGKAAKPKMTAEERAKAILEADKKKKEAADKKAADKAKREAEKRAEKLTTQLGKTDLKEADVAQQVTAARETGKPAKKFVDLTKEEADKAMEVLKTAAADKKKADALATRTALTAEEEVERRDLEKVVEKNLDSFQKAGFQIGGALTAISQKRLYRNTHKTFEAYVAERFGLSRPHAYSVMAAAQTFAALTEGGVVDAKSLPSITAAEAITRGVKGLLKDAGMADNPEVDAITRQLARNAYQVAVQNAPRDPKTGEPILNTEHITSTFKVLSEVAKAGVVEVDGKQLPVNLAAASIDEMITTESKERVDRMKASLADRVEAIKKATAEGNAGQSKLDGALQNALDRPLPAGFIPRLTTVCTFHGRNGIAETSDNDVRLECGCVFVSTPEGYTFDAETTEKLAAKKAKAQPAPAAAA